MKFKFRNVLLAFAALAMAGGVGAGVVLSNREATVVSAVNYKEVTKLDLTTKAYGASSYNTTVAYGDWTIKYGANNNKNWAFFKMGGSKTTLASNNPCEIYSTKASTKQYDKITVSGPSGSLSKTGMSVNSWGLYVYSDAKRETQVDYVAGGTITNAAWSSSFTPSAGKTWAAGYYYKVSWNLANTSSTNGIVLVDTITCFEESTDTIEDVTISGTTEINSGFLGLATTQLSAAVTATGGLAETVTWESDDTNVAIVDANGLVRLLDNGTANITAKSTVDPTVYDQVAVTASNLVAYDGLTDSADFTDTATWGTTTISDFSGSLTNVSFADGGSTGTHLLYHAEGNMRLYSSGVLSLTCSGAYSIEYVVLTSKSSNPFTVAPTVTEGSGALYGLDWFVSVSSGSSVTLSYTGVNAYIETMQVYYRSSGACGISVDNAVSVETKGNAGTFTATPSGATNPVITWSSSNPDVISINPTTGEYTVKFVGSTTITVDLACDEGADSTSFDVLVSGLITIAEANEILDGMAADEQTAYKVTISGYITDLNPNSKTAGNENEIILADYKLGGSGNDLMIYGIKNDTKLDEMNLREFAIINGTLAVTGNLKKWTTPELTNPTVVSYTDEAIKFAHDAYETLDTACASGVDSVTNEQWSDLATAWAGLDEHAQGKLRGATSTYAYNDDIAHWVGRYTIIVGAGRDDFMEKGIASAKIIPSSSISSTNVTLIVIFALIGAASVAGCIYFRKRRRA